MTPEERADRLLAEMQAAPLILDIAAEVRAAVLAERAACAAAVRDLKRGAGAHWLSALGEAVEAIEGRPPP